MHLKTFRAESLQEALQLVRAELGPDAAVVQTREVRQPRLGLFRKTLVEVEASVDVPVASHFSTTKPSASPNPAASSVDKRPGNQISAPDTRRLATDVTPGQTATDDSTTGFTGDRSSKLVGMAAPPNRFAASEAASPPYADWVSANSSNSKLSPAAYELLSELLERGVPPQRASQLLQRVCSQLPSGQKYDPWVLKGQVSQIVANAVNIGGPIEVSGDGDSHVVAFVGPTGVGKTTTLAKIAAGFRFDLGLDVGMITIDTFRLGAVDQLLQYAELISSPLEVVSSADQITGALQRLRECDVVLIDTAGRSPRDKEQLNVLADFLRAAQPDAIHLVVSAASSPANAQDAIDRFQIVQPTNMIMTKIDESIQLGAWFDLLSECPLPVSYITTGQHVPQDISVASRRRLASLLLGSSQHQEQST